MEIRKSINMEDLKRFYPVLRKMNNQNQRKKKITKDEKPKVKRNAPKVEVKQKIQKTNQKPKTKELKKGKQNARKQTKKDNKNLKPKVKPKRQAKKLKIEPEQRKKERLEKLDGKLLIQLQTLQERMDRMDREKERYALVDKVQEENRIVFTILRIGDPTKVMIKINNDGNVSCSCMDWLIRCRGLAIPCKHIYYFISKILTYELYDFFDNTIMKIDIFRELVDRRIRLDRMDFRPRQGEEPQENMCPICFLEFDGPRAVPQERLLKCPTCNHFIHQDCMLTWMNHSARRNCVVCRSEEWNMLFHNVVERNQ